VNLLFIHEVDLLQKVVFDIHHLTELLSIFGHNVFAVDFEDSWQRRHFLDFGTLRLKEFSNVNRAHDNANIKIIRPGLLKLPFLDRGHAFISHYFEINKIIKERKIDAIILYSVPTNGIQAVALAKRHKIPVIFRSIDVLHALVKNRVLRTITTPMEKWVYRHVDRILTLNPGLSDYVIKMGASEDKVEVLPFGVDASNFHPNVNVTELKKELQITDDDKIIVYIGTLFEFCGLDQYIKQFVKVVEQFPQVKLIIVGGGPLLDKLKKLVMKLNIGPHIIFTGFKPYQTMPQYINLADFCINPFRINDATRDIIPGKLLQYLACAKLVLATPLLGTMVMLPGTDHGIVYSDSSEFAVNTIKLLEDTEQTIAIGNNGYRYFKQIHDEKRIARRLETILSQTIYTT